MKKDFRTYVVLAMTVFSVVGTTLHYHHSSVASESLSINQESETEFCCPLAHNQENITLNHLSEGYINQPLAFFSILIGKSYLDSNINCQICDRAPPSI
jgi:hypothetical protein